MLSYTVHRALILLCTRSDLSKYMHTIVAHIFWFSTDSIFSCRLLHAFEICTTIQKQVNKSRDNIVQLKHTKQYILWWPIHQYTIPFHLKANNWRDTSTPKKMLIPAAIHITAINQQHWFICLVKQLNYMKSLCQPIQQ